MGTIVHAAGGDGPGVARRPQRARSGDGFVRTEHPPAGWGRPPQLIWATAAAAGAGIVLTALVSVMSAVAAGTQPMNDVLAEQS